MRNLFWEQCANITLGAEYSKDKCEIKRGVRQGCALSPQLYNIIEEIMKNSHIDSTRLRIYGQRINEISYTDDKVLITESERQMQKMLNKLNKAGIEYVMKINLAKPKS